MSGGPSPEARRWTRERPAPLSSPLVWSREAPGSKGGWEVFLGFSFSFVFCRGGGAAGRGAFLTFCSDRKLESESTVYPGRVRLRLFPRTLISSGAHGHPCLFPPTPAPDSLFIRCQVSFLFVLLSSKHPPPLLYFLLNVQLQRGWWLLHSWEDQLETSFGG